MPSIWLFQPVRFAIGYHFTALSLIPTHARRDMYLVDITHPIQIHMKFAPQSFNLKPTIEMRKEVYSPSASGTLANPNILAPINPDRAEATDYDQGVYTTKVERGLDDLAGQLARNVVVYPKWDLANLPADFRPFLAWELHADAYTTLLDLLYGESREVALIRGAATLNRLRGTKAAFNEFAKDAQFSYTMTEVKTDVGGINKVTSVNVVVVPAIANLSANVEWLEYIVRVMRNLLPVFIDLNRVTIENSINSTLNIAAGFNPFEIEVFN